MDYEIAFYFQLTISTCLVLIIWFQALRILKLTKKSEPIEKYVNPRDKEIIKYECEHCSNIIGVTYKALADTYQLHCHHCNQETKFSMPLSEEYINNRPKTTIAGYTDATDPIYKVICKHCDTATATMSLDKEKCFYCRRILPVIIT